MREYMLFQAKSRQAYGRWTGLVRVLKNWRLRRDVKKLQAMDAHMLNDIGFDHAALASLRKRSLWHDTDGDRDFSRYLRS